MYLHNFIWHRKSSADEFLGHCTGLSEEINKRYCHRLPHLISEFLFQISKFYFFQFINSTLLLGIAEKKWLPPDPAITAVFEPGLLDRSFFKSQGRVTSFTYSNILYSLSILSSYPLLSFPPPTSLVFFDYRTYGRSE